MNKTLLVILFFALSAASLYGQTTEKEVILKMAKSETEAYLKGNLQEWQSYRVKSNDASATFASSFGYNYIKSYDSVNKQFIPILKQMPK